MKYLKIIVLLVIVNLTPCCLFEKDPCQESKWEFKAAVKFKVTVHVVDQNGQGLIAIPVEIQLQKVYCDGRTNVGYQADRVTDSNGFYGMQGRQEFNFYNYDDRVDLFYTVNGLQYSFAWTGTDVYGMNGESIVKTFDVTIQVLP